MKLVLRRSSFIWQRWSMPGKNNGSLHGHQRISWGWLLSPPQTAFGTMCVGFVLRAVLPSMKNH